MCLLTIKTSNKIICLNEINNERSDVLERGAMSPHHDTLELNTQSESKGTCSNSENQTLTGELLVLAGDLETHAAGAAAIEATQFE